MSDEQTGNASYGQEVGTPSEIPQEQAPQYVTRDDLKKELAEVTEQLKRAVQGLTDKQENRVEKRLKEWESRLGYTPDPETRKLARAEAELDELRQTNGGGEVPAPSQAIDPVVKQTRQKALKLLADYGGDFDELTGIDTNPVTNPPERYLQQVEARMKSLHPSQAAPVPSQPDQPANLTHIPTVGTGGAPIGGNRLEQLTKRLQEIQAMGVQAMNNRALKKERDEIVAEMVSLEK